MRMYLILRRQARLIGRGIRLLPIAEPFQQRFRAFFDVRIRSGKIARPPRIGYIARPVGIIEKSAYLTVGIPAEKALCRGGITFFHRHDRVEGAVILSLYLSGALALA